MEAPCSRFTAAEGGARLATAASSQNTMAVEYATFISTRMIYELAYKIRGSLFDGKQRSVYVSRASRVDIVAYELTILTDLKICKAIRYNDLHDWCAELDSKEVLVCTPQVLKQVLEEELLAIPNINVLILDSCHLVNRDDNLRFIMSRYKECDKDIRPRILALTYPLFSGPKKDYNTTTDNKVPKVENGDEKIDTGPATGEILPKLKAILPSTEVKLPNSELLPSAKTFPKQKECSQEQEQTPIITQNTTQQHETTVTTDSEIEITTQQKENFITTDSEIEVTTQQKETLITTESEIEITTKEQIDFQNSIVYENLDDFEMYEKLEWKIEQLEKELCCQMDLAEDIDGGKRLSATLAKPKELIIEYSAQPSAEKLCQEYLDLESFMKTTVFDALAFLDEHRYDPTEIYGEDLYEEFKNIPDPTIDPKYIFKQFLYVLEQLGPYAADKAAITLLTKSEKLKIKVPYERHFLLLCLCTSVFVKIRCYAEQVFAKHESDWEKIKTFSTPKVIRFAEILEKFSPSEQFAELTLRASDDSGGKSLDGAHTAKNNDNNCDRTDDNKHESSNINKTNQLLDAIEKCDFISLSNKIEDTVNTIEANLKDLEDLNCNRSENKKNVNSDKQNNLNVKSESQNQIKTTNNDDENTNNNTGNMDNDTENRDNNTENRDNNTEKRNNNTENGDNDRNDNNNDLNEPNPNQQSVNFSMLGLPRRSGGYRTKGRGRTQRSNQSRSQQMQSHPDSLCGIVFMKEPLVAKIMFMLIVDMSRASPKLSFLCAQYCAVEQPADPGTEPRECQRQGKKQEDVLKKFRMHECNLLLATSSLEEGIDLPRCNLVLRWDVPASYRSYGLCRGRARAPRSACALLSCAGGGDTRTLLRNVAVYRELDQIISRKCGCGIQNEPPQSEEDHADSLSHLIKPYTPFETDSTTINNHKNKSNNTRNEKKSSGSDKKIKNKIENSDNNTVLSVVNPISKADSACILNEANNLICNKCNTNREHVDTECPCVSHLNEGCNYENKNIKMDKINEDLFASVDLNSAIALINRYCGKLPSDTFTRLAPQWWMEEVQLPVNNSGESQTAYICTLRLPLNCPLKYNIVGHPMPTKVLARRMVALQACRILHKGGELDNQLMPIGKENFETGDLDTSNVESNDGNESGRPGTTKRRQYYFKRTASAFTNCQPVVDTSDSEIEPPIELNKETAAENGPKVNADTVKNPGTKRNMLYAIVSKLWCALPERYNTRGRRLHVPQNASQAIGILMAREEPDNLQIPAFPVYTRSGEVRVSVEYVPDADVRLTPRRGRLIRRFMRFVFTAVLRVRRRGMRLLADAAPHNDYYIVPTLKTTREDGSTKIDIDWAFLELIYQHTEEKKNSETERPSLWQNDEEDDEIESQGAAKQKEKKRGERRTMDNPLLKEGETFAFNAERYREAVVTPWYRNQDQPQFFLVAEICWALTPDSAFPSATHTTFRQYYRDKYGVSLTQTLQPLLDVDHTSNRLNLLTPRYVNRKGVALPVSSERTRRAKRDRLDQKQILVPELCRVHPFAAPLWFATVALPCVLYRINALLIADEIRRSVAIDVGLGIPKIDDTTCPGFQWTPLDFGWSLSEVLSADAENNKEEKRKDESKEEREKEENDQEMALDDVNPTDECKEKTINEILEEKESAESGFEIGTWSNEMASSIPQNMEYDEFMEPLPSNLTFCTSASGGVNWCDPVEKPKREFQPSRRYAVADSDCSYMSSDFDTDDSDVNSEGSDDDTDTSGFCSSRNTNVAMGVRIEYKTAHEAEAVDLERQKKVNPAPLPDDADDALDRKLYEEFIKDGDAPQEFIEKFRQSVSQHKKEIVAKGLLIKEDEPITDILPEPTKGSHDKLFRNSLESKTVARNGSLGGSKKITASNVNYESLNKDCSTNHDNSIKQPISKSDSQIEDISNKLSKIEVKNETAKLISEIFPYGNTAAQLLDDNGQVSLEKIEKNKRVLLAELKKSLPKEEIAKMHCFSMKDVDIDAPTYVNEKVVNIGFDTKENYIDKVNSWKQPGEYTPYYLENKSQGKDFDFDYQPKLEGHPGPSPSVILQALTMSNANDGINLERLETIGDSFLKFAITAYLYCAHPTVHEGKLSHMRSKQVSNLNLYRLGRNKRLGARMIASKFEPHDNWLPPCHKPPSTLHPRGHDNERASQNPEMTTDSAGCFIPYNLITQHSIPDKSIADCVEALIGAYLLECGPRGALLFMSWLGIKVLPRHEVPLAPDHPYVKIAERHKHSAQPRPPPPSPGRSRRHEVTDSDTDSSGDEHDSWQDQDDSPPEMDWSWPGRPVGSLRPLQDEHGKWKQTIFGELKAPPSPLLRHIADPEGELEQMLSGYDALERTLQYRFKDRSLLLQALTHASHQQNRLTDCYQRLEFLGDAILDYLITRHLYEDPRRHSPGALTDLRSALVNNTIFATLAARHGFHKYFRHMAPGLNEVLTKYVKIQEENGHSISEEHYLIQEDAMEQAEDVEVPKALGDLFESVAGAVFLDSGMSLGAVWRSYGSLMGLELEAFSAAAPKSPVRELLEAEPDTAKFGKPERLADGRRVRVCVEVFGRGAFKGIGRNYRIAKGTAARCALRHLKGRHQR